MSPVSKRCENQVLLYLGEASRRGIGALDTRRGEEGDSFVSSTGGLSLWSALGLVPSGLNGFLTHLAVNTVGTIVFFTRLLKVEPDDIGGHGL